MKNRINYLMEELQRQIDVAESVTLNERPPTLIMETADVQLMINEIENLRIKLDMYILESVNG